MILATMVMAMAAKSQIPANYYSAIDGLRSTALKSALTSIISPHTVFGYNDLWEYYPYTYYVAGDHRQVLDMYGPTVRYYSSSVAVPNMNKEHTVPKSWWSPSSKESDYKTCDGYSDLFNVIPSDADANGRKSDHPLGVVSSQTYNNGIAKIGTGVVAGHAGTFFEPADKYKGDFARIYFYMATCYPTAAWENSTETAMSSTSPLTIQSWLYPLLVEWSNADPVDEAEIQRCADVAQLQGNRNPFVDYPELVNYIWGSDSVKTFLLSEHTANWTVPVALRACAPIFSMTGGSDASHGFETQSGTRLVVSGGNKRGTLFTRTNGSEWIQTNYTSGSSNGTVYYNAPKKEMELTADAYVEAYCSYPDRGNSDTIGYYYSMVDESPYLLYDDFNSISSGNNISTSGSTSAWDGDTRFPTVASAYCAGGAVRLGKSNAIGEMASQPLSFAGGALEVTIDFKGWDANSAAKLSIQVTGAKADTIIGTLPYDEGFESRTIVFNGVSANPVIKVSTVSKSYRAYIDRITVKDVTPNSVERNVWEENRPADTYSVDGRKVGSMKEGNIYIHNGKKVIYTERK